MPDLTTTMTSLQECVCAALEDIDRAVCQCGMTIGLPAQGPGGCCECSDGAGGHAAAFLERVYPADPSTFEQVSRLENCKQGPVAADIGLTVIRCYPSLNSLGQMPTLEQTTPFAEDLNTDLTAVWNALKCCGERIMLRESVVESDPEGGCSGFAIRVTVLVSMPQAETVGS